MRSVKVTKSVPLTSFVHILLNYMGGHNINSVPLYSTELFLAKRDSHYIIEEFYYVYHSSVGIVQLLRAKNGPYVEANYFSTASD